MTNRSKIVSFRLTPELFAKLTEKASLSGTPLSEWLRIQVERLTCDVRAVREPGLVEEIFGKRKKKANGI